MELSKIISLLLGLLFAIPASHGVSVSCMMAYERGGAPAVFESPECTQWVLSTESRLNQTVNCQLATLQGRREYQEDRIACDLEMKIPFLDMDASNLGLKEVTVGMVAVCDGHGGNEASEMASKYLFDYFYVHVLFKTYNQMVQYRGGSPITRNESMHQEILTEALSSTILDIDSTFSQEAVTNKFISGSTIIVLLVFDGKILVANVGDSKALLFSEKIHFGPGVESDLTTYLSAIELTKDHHPDRDDERARIEAAGGSVTVWGVPRVNGVLAMSRSIGDVYLKRYGVIAVPELTGWQTLTPNDKYLLVASDGIFESLTPDDICDIIMKWDLHFKESRKSKLPSSCLLSSSLAECVLNIAYDRGSADNLSAIVIPLGSSAASF